MLINPIWTGGGGHFLLNISKTVQLILTKLMSLFRQLSKVSCKIKRTKWPLIYCYHSNQLMGECLARKHDQTQAAEGVQDWADHLRKTSTTQKF